MATIYDITHTKGSNGSQAIVDDHGEEKVREGQRVFCAEHKPTGGSIIRIAWGLTSLGYLVVKAAPAVVALAIIGGVARRARISGKLVGKLIGPRLALPIAIATTTVVCARALVRGPTRVTVVPGGDHIPPSHGYEVPVAVAEPQTHYKSSTPSETNVVEHACLAVHLAGVGLGNAVKSRVASAGAAANRTAQGTYGGVAEVCSSTKGAIGLCGTGCAAVATEVVNATKAICVAAKDASRHPPRLIRSVGHLIGGYMPANVRWVTGWRPSWAPAVEQREYIEGHDGNGAYTNKEIRAATVLQRFLTACVKFRHVLASQRRADRWHWRRKQPNRATRLRFRRCYRRVRRKSAVVQSLTSYATRLRAHVLLKHTGYIPGTPIRAAQVTIMVGTAVQMGQELFPGLSKTDLNVVTRRAVMLAQIPTVEEAETRALYTRADAQAWVAASRVALASRLDTVLAWLGGKYVPTQTRSTSQ